MRVTAPLGSDLLKVTNVGSNPTASTSAVFKDQKLIKKTGSTP